MKKYLMLLLVMTLIIGSGSTARAQIEEDEFGVVQEEEISCAPDSLDTVYDSKDYGEVDSEMIRQWYSFGSEYYKNKNYKAALPYLWKVFISDSAKYGRNAIRKIADSYFKMQKADSTFIACYRGLVRYPDHVVLHYFVGFLQDNLGNVACAIPHYEALLRDNPEKEEYMEKLAFLYYKRKDEKAIEVQKKLSTLYPENSKYANDLAIFTEHFYGKGSGLEAYKQAWENDPENMDLALKYGESCHQNGNYVEALIPLNKVIAKDPANVKSLRLIALCDESLEKYSPAIEEYKKILQAEPNDVDIMCAIAVDYKILNQFSNGRYWVNKALSVKPGYGKAYIVMAQIYESSVIFCQDKSDRKRKYDDGLVYELAMDEYRKAMNDSNFKSDARRNMNNLKPYLPTDEEKFMNQNRKTLKEPCYTSWIN